MSEAMKKLQEKIGVGADGSFGPNTARAIAKHYDLSPCLLYTSDAADE